MKAIKYFLIFQIALALNLHAIDEKTKIAEFKENIYSQFGEDGIIRKIFEIIGVKSKTCIEFGAWDGIHLSNTANLFLHQSWKAVLIECDSQKYAQLEKNTKGYNCVNICQKVGYSDNDSLEAILKDNRIDNEIDLLSIDIDSDDYYVFQSLDKLRPRVIICEYNPTFPAEMDIYPDKNNYVGCSAGALIRIAREKGYSLVAMTDVNCFFVRNEEFAKFAEYETQLDKIKINKYLRYMVTDYAGRFCIIANQDFIEPYGINGKLTSHLNGNFQQLNYYLQQ